MSVGTVTFHWASNYGAILQAYALQHFLKSRGLDTEIIDYRPLRPRLIRTVERLRRREMSEFIRERRMRQFRRRHLDVSGRTYVSRRQLGESAALYDAFICGSDQIWNEWFTLNAALRGSW